MRVLKPSDADGIAQESVLFPRLRRPAGSQSGQSLVEVALALPVLLLLLVGIIEIGRFAYYSIVVANAARAGAQYAAQNLATAYDNAGIRRAARNDGQASGGITITVPPPVHTGDCTVNPPVCHVEVTASGQVSPLFPLAGRFTKLVLPNPITFTSTVKMQVGR
jgi:Flp pilus assembly protein TadG